MTTDFTVIMFIAVVEAMVIGWLISDKLGLIKDTKIDDNPNNDKWKAYSTKCPIGKIKQGKCGKSSHTQNDHTTADNIGKPFKVFVLVSHITRIIKNKLRGSNLD